MKRLAMAALAVILLASSTIGCSTSKSTTQEASTPRLVASFSGNNSKTTAMFTTTKANWYIDYSCTLNDKTLGVMVFSAAVMPASEPSDSINYIAAVMASQTTSDISGVYGHKGSFYFVVSSAFADWKLDVYE